MGKPTGEHNYTFLTEGGVWIVKCKCGKKSPPFDEQAEWHSLVSWCNDHQKEGVASMRQVR